MLCNCNYGCCQPTDSQPTVECTTCTKGMMILVGIISGILFAVAGVLLFINSLLTVPAAAAWTTLAAAAVYLTALLILPAASCSCGKIADCIRCHFGGIITGVFGALFSSVIGVALTLTVGDILSTVIIALIFFFFAYMIVSTLFLIKCLISD